MNSVLPISYWGSIAYFQELVAFETVELEVWEHFPKQTHRNRLAIVTPQGMQYLTLPVVKKNGSKTLIKDIELVDDKANRMKMWRAIVSAYASSPYFDHYEKELSDFFLQPNLNLVQHTKEISAFLLKNWGFETLLKETSHFYNSDNLEKDYFDSSVTTFKPYTQVEFSPKPTFFPNISTLDLLCCLGPLGRNHLLPQR